MNDTRAPVFVKVDEYKDIVDIVTLMREKIKHAKLLLDKIAEQKAKEDAELASWARELENIEHSVSNVDRTLLEPGM